jgi:hypothetical protein
MKQEKVYEKVDVNARAAAETYNDICSTCNDVEGCVNLKSNGRPKWFCEQFDNYMPIVHPTLTEVIDQASPDPMADKGHEFKGLCVNCEERHTCNLMKPNGGVWHCEEYK